MGSYTVITPTFTLKTCLSALAASAKVAPWRSTFHHAVISSSTYYFHQKLRVNVQNGSYFTAMAIIFAVVIEKVNSFPY